MPPHRKISNNSPAMQRPCFTKRIISPRLTKPTASHILNIHCSKTTTQPAEHTPYTLPSFVKSSANMKYMCVPLFFMLFDVPLCLCVCARLGIQFIVENANQIAAQLSYSQDNVRLYNWIRNWMSDAALS